MEKFAYVCGGGADVEPRGDGDLEQTQTVWRYDLKWLDCAKCKLRVSALLILLIDKHTRLMVRSLPDTLALIPSRQYTATFIRWIDP